MAGHDIDRTGEDSTGQCRGVGGVIGTWITARRKVAMYHVPMYHYTNVPYVPSYTYTPCLLST